MLTGMSNKVALLLVSLLMASCGGLNSGGSGNSSAGSGNSSAGSGNIFGGQRSNTTNTGRTPQGTAPANKPTDQSYPIGTTQARKGEGLPGLNINDLLFPPNDNADIRVNKYLWEASLEILNFLPIEAADPFTGVLIMGWGRAPGSSTSFRATILIQDPALEAGSLKVAMQKRNGPASVETNRQIEDAILTRARQLRIKGAKRR